MNSVDIEITDTYQMVVTFKNEPTETLEQALSMDLFGITNPGQQLDKDSEKLSWAHAADSTGCLLMPVPLRRKHTVGRVSGNQIIYLFSRALTDGEEQQLADLARESVDKFGRFTHMMHDKLLAAGKEPLTGRVELQGIQGQHVQATVKTHSHDS